MGNRLAYSSSSAPPISIAEARKHLSNEEFVRLQNAFGRIKKSHLSIDDFSRHVLGGANVPDDARKALFKFFSRGGDTVSFDNLVCALVGICRSEQAQANFIEEHREFASWGLRPPLLTIPVNDAYINFYDVMSYVTHLQKCDVMELEQVFLRLSGGSTVMHLPGHWKKAAGGCFEDQFIERLFKVFDENHDGEVDFREMVCGVSAMCRAPLPSRYAFLAKLWDEDGDGMLDEKELNTMYEELAVPPARRTVEKSGGGGSAAAMVDVAQWAIQNPNCIHEIYARALEMGHVCFGLRPESAAIELDIVKTMEERLTGAASDSIREFNIMSTVWRREWESSLSAACNAGVNGNEKEHVATLNGNGTTKKTEGPPPIDNSPLISNVEAFPGCSKMLCISPESSCLRRDLTEKEWMAVPRCLWSSLVRWHRTLRPGDEIVRRRLSPPLHSASGHSLELYPLHVVLERRTRFSSQGGSSQSSQSSGISSMGEGGGRETFSWAWAQLSRTARLADLLTMAAKELRTAEADCRLWLLSSPSAPPSSASSARSSPSSSPNGSPALIDDPSLRLCDITSGGDSEPVRVLLEQRERATGVWPEEARFAQSGASIPQSSARGPAVGLINYGNFCYRNAAVQCLARVEPLSECLLEREQELREKATKGGKRGMAQSTALQYIQLLREMRTTGKKNISPVHFNEAVRDSRQFDGAMQHDCEEFVSFLLNQIHSLIREETPKEKKNNEVEAGKGKGDEKKEKEKEEEDEDEEMDEERAEKAWAAHLASEKSTVISLFNGQLRSSLLCQECGRRSARFDPFVALPVPIGFESVELFEVMMVLRDASIPRGYGARLPRDATARMLRKWLEEKTGLPEGRVTIIRLAGGQERKRLTILGDDDLLGRPVSSVQLYGMETDGGRMGEEGERRPLPAVHRRTQLTYEAYLLGAASGCSVSLFGVPIVVQPPPSAPLTGRALYDDVWRQLHRFLATPPPSFASRALDPCEDASAGFPFSLSIVDESLEWCASCSPLRFCRGCPVNPTDTLPPIKDLAKGAALAVDWQPIALYLRYNHSQALACTDDASLTSTRELHVRPSSLDHCLRRFASTETLEDAMECSRCKKKTKRDKHMDIVQLKRFEYVREEGRMAKCKRVIDFPLSAFDASPYIKRGAAGREGSLYDCIAIANHYGELDAGHFVAYARGREGWLLLNDCTVREVGEEDVDKKGAYLLFYERRVAIEEEDGVSHL